MSIIVLTDRGGPSNCSMMDKDSRQNPRALPFSFPPNLCYCESSRDSKAPSVAESPFVAFMYDLLFRRNVSPEFFGLKPWIHFNICFLVLAVSSPTLCLGPH